MGVHCVEFEICDIIVNFRVYTVQKFNIEDKMICACIHNTNTNCSEAQNQSNNNADAKLGNYGATMHVELAVCMHDSQMCVQTGCSTLPVKTEVVLVKVHEYFYICIE